MINKGKYQEYMKHNVAGELIRRRDHGIKKNYVNSCVGISQCRKFDESLARIRFIPRIY